MASSETKRLKWFEDGALSLQRSKRIQSSALVYACPICLREFQRASVLTRELSSEHVPPESLGGMELLLTCRRCNNESGTRLDAHAARERRVNEAMTGRANGKERVRATLNGLSVYGSVIVSDGQYKLELPARANNPAVLERLKRPGLAGSNMTVQYQPYAQLGANISWLRSGYLVLVARFGFELVLDKAFDSIRRQILENDTSLMRVWFSDASDVPEQQRALWTVLAPVFHRGYAVQFGRRFIHLPKPGDVTFYDRLGDPAHRNKKTTVRFEGLVDEATFGSMVSDSALGR